MDTKELKDKVDNWVARGKKWTLEGQTLGLAILAHIEQHGDTTIANRLLTGMPKGTKRNAMAEWLMAFGKLQINDDKASASTSPLKFAKDKVTNIAGAAAKPWFDFQPEKDIAEVFDIQKAVQAILQRAGKAESVNDPALLQSLQQLAAEHTAALEAGAAPGNPPAEETSEEPSSTVADPLASA